MPSDKRIVQDAPHKSTDKGSADSDLSRAVWDGIRALTEPVKADGAPVVTVEKDGTVRSASADGKVSILHSDGTGSLRTPNGKDGYTEAHWGPDPAKDTYQWTRTPDGRVLLERPNSKPAVDITDSTDVNVQRQRLNDVIEHSMADPAQRERFRRNEADFEARAKKAGLGEDQIAGSYKNIALILEAPGDKTALAVDRGLIAGQLMDQLAHPTSIHQGQHKTCNVTAVETRTCTRYPAAAASLIRQVVLNGTFTTSDGDTLQIPRQDLVPDSEAQRSLGKDAASLAGGRSFVSQLFQVTAVNTHWLEEETCHFTSLWDAGCSTGNVRYEQDTPSGFHDTAERLRDYTSGTAVEKTNGDGKPYRAPDLSDEEIAEVSKQITGKDDKLFFIRSGDSDSDAIYDASSEDALRLRLLCAKATGDFPMILKVHTYHEPFYTDSGAGAAGGSGGWHVVTITDYDLASSKLAIDNQWGDNVDHLDKSKLISLADAYHAMQNPTWFDVVEHNIKQAVASNRH